MKFPRAHRTALCVAPLAPCDAVLEFQEELKKLTAVAAKVHARFVDAGGGGGFVQLRQSEICPYQSPFS